MRSGHDGEEDEARPVHTRDEEGTTSSCGANERSVSSKLAFGAQEHDFSFVGSAVGPLERCFATHGSAAPVALPDSVAEGRRLDRVARKSPGRKFGRDGHAPSLAGQSARGHPFLEAPRQWSPARSNSICPRGDARAGPLALQRAPNHRSNAGSAYDLGLPHTRNVLRQSVAVP